MRLDTKLESWELQRCNWGVQGEFEDKIQFNNDLESAVPLP